MMRFPLLIGAAFLLGACSKPFVIEDPVPPFSGLSYVVFFRTGSANLDQHAIEIIYNAVKDAKSIKANQIILEGMADRVGSENSNKALSMRRVIEVEKEMERLGLDEGIFILKALGEDDRLVPTGDGVPEEKNRAVAITVR